MMGDFKPQARSGVTCIKTRTAQNAPVPPMPLAPRAAAPYAAGQLRRVSHPPSASGAACTVLMGKAHSPCALMEEVP